MDRKEEKGDEGRAKDKKTGQERKVAKVFLKQGEETKVTAKDERKSR